MKRLMPGSLAGRTLLILFIGLTLSHIVSILVFTSEKMETAVLTSEQQLLERMAILTRLLCDAPESLHAPILSAMNRDGVPIDVTYVANGSAPIYPNHIESLRQALEQQIGRTQVHVLAVHIQEPDWHHAFGTLHRWLFWIEMQIIRAMHTEVIDQEWHVVVQLPNQKQVLLTSLPAGNHVPLFRHATLSVLIMSVAILLFVLVMVRHMTRPWQKIIQAAEVFGQDVYAKPLPEEGATEIVHAARIFNRMNQRIRAFVEEQLQMIAAISHDLRTPLTQLRLMAEFSTSAEERMRMIAILDEMEKMFTATLSFARDSAATEPKQSLNLSGLLAAICSDMVDAGALVQFDEGDKLPYFCRPMAMKRAMVNLIDNAIQYGGRADVRITSTPDRVDIQIQDPGAGIPEAEWDNVMRPFRRLEPSRNRHTGGVGMGLAIAHSVIHDHGGEIRFVLPAAGGFLVKVVLPLHK
ncbi:MAG: ATP-binding protein [Magnetococcales bacterium]|nr:ATP-binding protein [Magnetococcales bacterium]